MSRFVLSGQRWLFGIIVSGCVWLMPRQVTAEDAVTARKLILEPGGWERDDLTKAEKEIERNAVKQIDRWKAWKTLVQNTDAFIEEFRQRVLDEHARILAYNEVAQANYSALCLKEGWVRFPKWGAYDGASSKDALAASIAADKRRIEDELKLWEKGDVPAEFPHYPGHSFNSVKREVKEWERRIEEFEATIKKGEGRVGGRPWFFGSANRNDMVNVRRDSERNWKEKEDRLNAMGERVSLREIGFATAADVDREIENTKRELKEVEEMFARKEYGIDRWGMGGMRKDVEQRIATWQKEIAERQQALEDGTFRVGFPYSGWRSRKELAQDNENLKKEIDIVNTALKKGEYKVDCPAVGQVDANFLNEVLKTSKDANQIADSKDGLRRIPIAAAMHRRYFELLMLRNDQCAAAIPKMSRPAFVRPELEIQQANEFLPEYDREWQLIKARADRKLNWLARCRAAITGEKAPLSEPPIAQAVSSAVAGGADIDAVIAVLQEAIQKLEALKRKQTP